MVNITIYIIAKSKQKIKKGVKKLCQFYKGTKTMNLSKKLFLSQHTENCQNGLNVGDSVLSSKRVAFLS